MLKRDGDHALENLPGLIQTHGDETRSAEEVGTQLFLESHDEPILDAVELRAEAEMLERHDLVVVWDAVQEVDTEELPDELLVSVAIDIFVVDSGPPKV